MVFERLPKPTLLDLQRRLRQHQYHVLHFIGFSIYDPQTQDGVLIWRTKWGAGVRLAGSTWARCWATTISLRLAVLSIAERGADARHRPGRPSGRQLVRRGLPAAVLQPTKLLDRPSLAFVHEFYIALANLRPVDVAMAEARRAIQLEEFGAGWGVPQLVSRLRVRRPVRAQVDAAAAGDDQTAAEPPLGVSPRQSLARCRKRLTASASLH